MNLDLQIALSRLASNELQQKFCVNGTAKEYLLPEELFDSALYSAETELSNGRLSAQESVGVGDFLKQANDSAEELSKVIAQGDVSIEKFLAQPAWIRVRESAMKCLTELGLELRCDG